MTEWFAGMRTQQRVDRRSGRTTIHV